MEQRPFFLFVCAPLIISCGGPSERIAPVTPGLEQQLSMTTTDTAQFRLAGELARKHGRIAPDTAWKYLLIAEEAAGRIGGDSFRYEAEDLHFEVLNGRTDPAAVGFAQQLIMDRDKHGAVGPSAFARVNLGLALGQRGHFVQADSVMQTAIPMALTTSDSGLIMQAYMMRMSMANTLWPADTALLLLEKAIAYCPLARRDFFLGKLRTERANMFYNLGLLDSAIAEADKALELNRASNDSIGEMATITVLAAYYVEKAELPTAVELQLRALAMAERMGQGIHVAINAFNLGNAYRSLMRYPESLAMFSKAEHISDSIGMVDIRDCAKGYRAIIWSNLDSARLAALGIEQKRLYDTTTKVMRKALDDVRRNGNLGLQQEFLLASGQAHLLWHKPELAAPLLREAMDIASASGNDLTRSATWKALGDLAFEQGQWRSALDRYDSAMALCERMGRREQIADILDQSQLAHERLGDTKAALAAMRRSKQVAMELYNDSTTGSIARLEARYAYQKRALADSLAHVQQITLERKDAEIRSANQRKTLFVVIGGALLLLIGGSIAFYLDRRRKQERYEKDAALLETQALRSQMNPHFIFNALNSINAYVQTNDAGKASDYLAQFARLMRMVLENSRHAEVPLKDDLDALRGYFELERARTNEKFDYAIEVDPAIDQEQVLVPPLVLQPFVENAIWHGMAGRTDKGRITLRVSRRGEDIVMAVEDDGRGRLAPKVMMAGMPEKKSSLGTAITKARLDLIGKQKGRPAGFTYTDLPQGTRVEVTLPATLAA